MQPQTVMDHVPTPLTDAMIKRESALTVFICSSTYLSHLFKIKYIIISIVKRNAAAK